jgi:hypothetical protein
LTGPRGRDGIEHLLGNPNAPRTGAALVQQQSVTVVILGQYALAG